ncbi:LytR/AlgR family response regulator transcription factor [Fonticella tunisiensis]|uniref:Stage 0 sporulation protein A homolog n=1 Tax=Fonticella tunisiensis TaxID=1096341 RepID=A0A4R7KR92_9CLOT|nr:LytTR family DNA-binding domain-containing protein [Fonticella tunisiensis]TDT61892.1 LytTR family two component transcriptional regulator [Fonticella tunisiensis]
MKTVKCIIVEDEFPSEEELKYLLSQYDFLSIEGSAFDGNSGYEMVKKIVPDVVFLDINLPGMNGIELAKKIRDFNKNISIVFVTAYDEYALEAFELYAMDYVLKPYDERRIYNTIIRIKDRLDNNVDQDNISDKIEKILVRLQKIDNTLKKIPCEYGGKTVLVDIKDVYYCFIEDEQIYVKLKNKKYYSNYALHEIEERTGLFRTHRSFLVNLDHVKELYPWFHGTYKLVMDDNEKSEIPVSRNNVKRMKEILGL